MLGRRSGCANPAVEGELDGLNLAPGGAAAVSCHSRMKTIANGISAKTTRAETQVFLVRPRVA
ncbi:MAG: hypothetical protein WBQ82_01730 [Methyloceanibacter sp.]